MKNKIIMKLAVDDVCDGITFWLRSRVFQDHVIVDQVIFDDVNKLFAITLIPYPETPELQEKDNPYDKTGH